MKSPLKFILILSIAFLTILYFNCQPAAEAESSEKTGSNDNNGSAVYFASGLFDFDFNYGDTGAGSTVYCIAVRPDGKIMIAGSFSTYNQLSVSSRIIRLNTDGSIDQNFNIGGSGFNAQVNVICLQPNGKILAAGSFTTYNGIDIPDRIIRLNANGTVDSTFNSGGAGADGIIYATALQPDGKIIIGGNFSSYNGSNTPGRIRRLNADGSIDTAFNNGEIGISLNTVYSIKVTENGKILIAGNFSTYNNINTPDGLMRLNADGSIDSTFNNGGTGFPGGTIRDIEIRSDGRILACGAFLSYNGISSIPCGLIRLNADGTYDPSFNGGSSGFSTFVWDILIQTDGRILACGDLITYNGLTIPNNIIRLNNNGSFDASFNGGNAGTNQPVYVMAMQADKKILIGGYFTAYNGIDTPDCIIRLY